ncbi:MAG: homocysteine S-methyltransferase family protein [Planctomycetota bacterium]
MSDRKPFLNLVNERVVVLDGAMGSALQEIELDLDKDWMGQENMSEVLNLSRPDVIESIHKSFLEIGCDAVQANSFGGNRIVMAEAEMEDRAYEVSRRAAEIARSACDAYETPDSPRYAIASVGPGTKIASFGNVDWDTMEASYYDNVKGVLDGGADVLLSETAQDLLQIKVFIAAARRAFDDTGRKVPVMVQASFDLNNGANMLTGPDPETFVATFVPFYDSGEIDVLGLNCAYGPQELSEAVRTIAAHWPGPVSVVPNAGLPIMVNGQSQFPLQPHDFAAGVERFVREVGVNIVGGCCGTKVQHLKALIDRLGQNAPATATA